MKRFIALVLSLVMALSLCAPAWGVPTDAETALQDALNAGGTVTLTSDVTVNDGLIVPADTTVVLDLNGKTITGAIGRDADNNRIHTLVNNGTLTVKNGTVKSAGNDGGSAICNNAGATLTVEEVALFGAPQSDPVYEAGVSKPFPSYAVNNYGNAEINGATIKSYHGAIATGGNGVTVINDADIDVGLGQSTGITSYIIYSYEDAKVTVNDGKFAFTKKEIYVNGGNTFCELGTNPIIVNGGNYIGTSFSTGDGREYVIKGGTFDMNPTKYVPDDGWYTITEGDGTWTVTKAPVVAKIGEVEYKTLAEAVAVGGTVELLTNVTLEKHVNISKDTVINLNGYNIAKTEGNTIFYVTDGAALTINGTGVETISLENADGAYAIWSAGNGIEANEITLNQVTVEATTCGVYHNGNDFGAKVTIEKSTVKGGGAGVFLSGSEEWADPQNNKMNDLVITDSTIEGASAVEVKHGNVVVDNSTLKATGEPDVRNYGNGSCTEGYALALTNNGMENAAEASTGTVQINSGNFTGNIGIKDDDTTAMVENTTTAKIQISGGTFSADPKAYVVDGYAATEVEGKYVVAVKKAETNKVETEVKVDVAEPSVEVPVIDTSDMTEKDKTLVENVANSLKEDGVKFDDTALVAAAAEAKTAVENKVTAAEAADLLAEENIPVASDDKVSIVVQPYYDVKVESITVDENGAASVALDITPMYQTVVTTAAANEEIVTKDTAEVGEEVNAVAVGDPKEMTVTKPVTIKIAIPSNLAIADGDGFKPLYVTHTKEETGVKFVYVAKVEKDGSDYTATFVNPNGFSSFTLSTTNSTVAYVKDSNTSYATIESAISDAGKGAVIEVLVSDQVVNITAPCSFKLKWADNITEPTFNVAKGYTMSKWYVNGVYTYIVQSASAGGYAPSTTPEKVVTSADTFDAGIALYVGMSVMAAAGSAVVLKKRED